MEELIWRGSQDVIVKDDLEQKLKADQPLRVKYGIDPTAERIHIGHAATIRKLKHFQDAGHQIVLIVGDFTARIGDPSDKAAERQPLSDKDIQHNMKRYRQLLDRILDVKQAELHHNSEWFKKLGLATFMELAQQFSVAQMIERDNFDRRFKAGKRIGLQEFLYPVLQGYDSVAVEADVEIGGTDQLFNLLAGRPLQQHYGQPEQNIITYELLLGPDGRKMSKSWDNAIWIDDEPADMFGKLMRVNDEHIYDYFRLVTEISNEELQSVRQQSEAGKNLRDLKARMAQTVVALYHGEEDAQAAAAAFDRKFKDKTPGDQDYIDVGLSNLQSRQLADVLMELDAAASRSEARRLMGQRAVKVNGDPVDDPNLQVQAGDMLQVGKRHFFRFNT